MNLKSKDTESFLLKSKERANPNLDLSRVNYVNTDDLVEVSCKKHPGVGIFTMKPKYILEGNNSCKQCIKESKNHLKLTQDDFIAKCKANCWHTLDFSKAVYVNKRTKVEVTCRQHPDVGSFYMSPHNIYRAGRGCPICIKEGRKAQNRKGYSQESFIKRATNMAAKNLDLSKIIFTGVKNKVEVACNQHPEQGGLWIRPDQLLEGKNPCKACLKNTLSLSHDEFLAKYKDKINKNLDLSLFVYSTAREKAKFKCKKHPDVGTFEMTIKSVSDGRNACPACHEEVQELNNQNMTLTLEEFLERAPNRNPNLVFTEATYTKYRQYITGIKCSKHLNTVFSAFPQSVVDGRSCCPHCRITTVSKKEKALANFVRAVYAGEVVANAYNVLARQELDVYLPKDKMAIEFNGLYWHSSAIKKPKYHYNKYKECQSKGIRLIQIWEDDWDNKRDVVKHFLQQELNVLPIINVEDTMVTTVLEKDTVADFLNTYHLEGAKYYSYALALTHRQTKELLAVMTFVKTANNGELLFSRFATKTAISGGFNALIDTAKENCVKGLYKAKNGSKVTHFIAYTNNETDIGEVYKNNGWQKVANVPVAYTYWSDYFANREPKFNYQLKRFRDDPNLEYVEGLSAGKLAELNCIYKCYDTGKQKWLLNIF